jgi:hypothetical protein
MYKVAGFHKQLEGKNGGGDPWYTDGVLWVGVIKKDFAGDGLATGLETTSTEFGQTVTAGGRTSVRRHNTSETSNLK